MICVDSCQSKRAVPGARGMKRGEYDAMEMLNERPPGYTKDRIQLIKTQKFEGLRAFYAN